MQLLCSRIKHSALSEISLFSSIHCSLMRTLSAQSTLATSSGFLSLLLHCKPLLFNHAISVTLFTLLSCK